MPNLIYVHALGQHDHARWLVIDRVDSETVVLHLSDLCQPGKVSGLKRAPLPMAYFESVLTDGVVQVTLPQGYLSVRPSGPYLQIEFRAPTDGGPTKVSVLIDDVTRRLAILRQPAAALA